MLQQSCRKELLLPGNVGYLLGIAGSGWNRICIDLHIVHFTKIQEAIHENCPEEMMITLMRRFMFRIAERLSIKLGSQAIITGESLGQVASQTIESITSSNSVVTMPVLRPLIAFDKLDIIEISRKIDTYGTSILPYEDCCTVFVPEHPVIKPDIDKVKSEEAKCDFDDLIEEAIANIEEINLDYKDKYSVFEDEKIEI